MPLTRKLTMPASMTAALKFQRWIDAIPWATVQPSVVAFALNLYEAPGEWHAELVGCPCFDPNDADWACNEVFSAREPVLVLSHADAGSTWEQALIAFAGLLRAYLDSGAAGAQRLSTAQAVAYGFVDGDLEILQCTTAA